MEYENIVDENDVPCIVQDVFKTLANEKTMAVLFDGAVLSFYDYEIARLLGKPFKSASMDEITKTVCVLAEREYFERKTWH